MRTPDEVPGAVAGETTMLPLLAGSEPAAVAGGVPVPADQAQRLEAIDPTLSCIVQAPAGSGKTELLSRRFLRLLTVVDEPEEIIALTFTRKAAREMLERITESLRLATCEPPDDPYHRATRELALLALERDKSRKWNLLAHPSRLRVTTIDALCQAIVRRLPTLSEFGSVPDVAESPDEIYASAARETIATLEEQTPWTDALARLLRHVDGDVPNLQKLIVGMLGRRDQWLRHIGWIQPGLPENTVAARAELERALRSARAVAVAQLTASAPGELLAEVVALARHAAGVLSQTADPSTPLAACEDLRAVPEGSEGVEAWQGIAYLLLTAEGKVRRTVARGIGFVPRDSEKRRMVELLGALADGSHGEFITRLHAIRDLPPARYTDAQWEVIEALIAVLKASVGFLRTGFEIEGVCDFAEIAFAARSALDDDGSASELAISLDARIQHILVDEFQDTSHSQFELLQKLTREWSGNDGRTLFLVGDPMQSIYRFREADVGLFLQAWESGIGRVPLKQLRLSVNFRSTPTIVNWVNETFERILPATNDIGAGAVAYSPSVAGRDGALATGVELHATIGVDRVVEAANVLEIIRAESATNPGASIAILVKERNALKEIVPALRRAGVPFQAVEIDALGELPAISDLLALTRAILNPADRIAWLAVLRAPWCGLTLADLHALAGGDRRATILDLMRNPERMATMSADGAARVARILPVLERVFAGYQRTTLRRTVEGCWLELGGPACLPSEVELRDTRRFFELIDQHEEGGAIVDLEALELAVSKLYASPDLQQDRLQVMTIHKAKGLEFDVVILPALDRRGRGDDVALLLCQERQQSGTNDLLMAPIKACEEKSDAVYSFIRGLESERARHEQRRLLYVAATRARRRLHLLGCVAAGKLDTVPAGLLAFLYPLVRQQFHDAAARIAGDAVTADGEGLSTEAPPREPRPIRRLVAGWTIPPPPPDVQWIPALGGVAIEPRRSFGVQRTWAEATTRHVGTVVHELFCLIARTGLESWSERRLEQRRPWIRSSLLSLGVATVQLDQAEDRVIEAVRWTLADDRGRWILSHEHTEAGSELPVTGIIDGDLRSVRIDRTFIDSQGVRWVIDYKIAYHAGGEVDAYLDRERERYAPQLREYAVLLHELDPARPIRCCLYFPNLGCREWDETVASGEVG